jgi:hypothetical protein
MVRLKDEMINGRRWHFQKDKKGQLWVKTDELKYYEPWTNFERLTKKKAIDILKKVK